MSAGKAMKSLDENQMNHMISWEVVMNLAWALARLWDDYTYLPRGQRKHVLLCLGFDTFNVI